MTDPATWTYAGLRLAGIVLFVLAAQFLTVIMLAASIAPGYDMGTAAISDLGVITETALLFNLSLIAVGALNAVSVITPRSEIAAVPMS